MVDEDEKEAGYGYAGKYLCVARLFCYRFASSPHDARYRLRRYAAQRATLSPQVLAQLSH